MTQLLKIARKKNWSWDNLGIGIAGLCMAHCLATTVILALAASASSVFGNPIIHETGLLLALIFGSIALGKGVLDHGFMMPAAIGGLGIGIMAGALSVPHGSSEVIFTILGVGILALGHDLNRRAAR
jgi:MerC mercury resistance protein